MQRICGRSSCFIGYGCPAHGPDGAEQNQVDRATFVKNVLQAAEDNTDGRYNVMVFDTYDTRPGTTWMETHPFTQSLQGILYTQNFVYNSLWDGEDHHFTVWVFDGGGSFDNQWDGGWINWAFYGSWNQPNVQVCIDDYGSGTNNGNTIDIWDCNGTGAQEIVFTHGTNGVGTLVVLGKCLVRNPRKSDFRGFLSCFL